MKRKVSGKTASADPLLIAIAGIALAITIACVAVGLSFLRSYLLGINLATFLAYGVDKRQAIVGSSRTPEIVLHALALAGGTPGAFLGQVVFRHKTQKRGFRTVFIAIALLQALVLTAWWQASRG